MWFFSEWMKIHKEWKYKEVKWIIGKKTVLHNSKYTPHYLQRKSNGSPMKIFKFVEYCMNIVIYEYILKSSGTLNFEVATIPLIVRSSQIITAE